MWSERKQLGMLRCSQQVAEHSATGTCIPLFLSLVFFLSSLLSFCMFTDLSITLVMTICYRAWRKAHACRIPPKLTLSVTHTHTRTHTHFYTLTHTQSEGEHQQLVFSLCFFTRAALILLDKGWESQENIIAHTHTHTHSEMCHAAIHLHTDMCRKIHISHGQHTQQHISASGILP